MAPKYRLWATLVGLLVFVSPLTVSAATIRPKYDLRPDVGCGSNSPPYCDSSPVQQNGPAITPPPSLARPRVLRQEENAASTVQSSRPSSTQSSTQSGSSSQSPASRSSQSENASTANSSSNRASTMTLAPSDTEQVPSPSTTASTDNGEPVKQDKNALPLKPIVTPGMGIAGVILLGTGLAFTLIGTKNKWIHIFFSVAFLASVSVTVLIIYLFNPPVSPALEGAFLVAAVVTGVIFGVLSNVFSEVTEGLGCLLGGFCLAMWFLCLRAGGLIHPQFGRITLIAAIGLTSYGFSFSSKTRTYASLVSASFAGATATILGIDCFSRAGLKEFWLYLWNLNPNLFPLGTKTYPLTRGIRVELAGIILLFMFGLVSQFKVWKLVKARRERKNADRQQEEKDLERLESEVGRQIEEEVQREKAIWEETYGNKPNTGSTSQDQGETGKIRAISQDDTILDGQPTAPQSPGTDQVGDQSESANADGDEGEMINERSDLTEMPFQVPGSDKKRRRKSKRKDKSSRPSAAAPTGSMEPTIVEEPGEDADGVTREAATEDQTAVDTAPGNPDQAGDSDADREGRHSDASSSSSSSSSDSSGTDTDDSDDDSDGSDGSDGEAAAERAHRRTSQQRGGVKKAVGVGAVGQDDDSASSVAANIEGSSDGSSRHLTDTESESGDDDDDEPADETKVAKKGKRTKSSDKKNTDDGSGADKTDLADSLKEDSRPQAVAEEGKAKDGSVPVPVSTPKKSKKSVKRSRKARAKSVRVEASEDEEAEGEAEPMPLVREHLPTDKITKAARSFRTNEWAKHLDLAEDPDAVGPLEPAETGGQVDESTMPLDEADTEERPPSPSVQIGFRKRPLVRSQTYKSPVMGGFGQASSQPASNRMSVRNSSAPVTAVTTPQIGTVPPVLEEQDETAVTGFGPTTLLSKRQTMMGNKMGTMSFANLGMTSKDDLENQTLAERKALLQRGQLDSTGSGPQTPLPISRTPSYGADTSRISLQPPSRQTSWGQAGPSVGNRQQAMMASWRESTAGLVGQTAAQVGPVEDRRTAMIYDQRQRQMEKQTQTQRESFQNHVRGERMRTGDMIDAHRQAMKRLQAQTRKE